MTTIPAPNIPGQAEPKAKPKKKKGEIELDGTLESNVRMLISMGFGLAATLTKNGIWNVANEEAKAMSEPLTRILQRMGVSESMSKYGDWIALSAAATVTLAPRILITMAQAQEQKGKVHDDRKTEAISANGDAAGGSSDARNAPDDSSVRSLAFGIHG